MLIQLNQIFQSLTRGGLVATCTLTPSLLTASPSTTFSYDSGALIYIKNIFPDLTTIAEPITVISNVTKTCKDGALAVYTGPVILGP